MKIKIASWNINGLRAVLKKNSLDEIINRDFDIYCFQETKINEDTLKPLKLEEKFKKFEQHYSFSTVKKGYSGVSVWSKIPILSVDTLNIEKFDQEGRLLVVEFENFYLLNGYFPNGQNTHKRVPYKLDFSYEVLKLSNYLKKDKPVIICGDINTAHTEIDLSNPKQNINTTGFLKIERDYIDNLIKDSFLDAYRIKNKETKNIYSWWSYRTNARSRNIGWRIDYFFIDKILKNNFLDCYYLKEQFGSDHCPVVLELSFK